MDTYDPLISHNSELKYKSNGKRRDAKQLRTSTTVFQPHYTGREKGRIHQKQTSRVAVEVPISTEWTLLQCMVPAQSPAMGVVETKSLLY